MCSSCGSVGAICVHVRARRTSSNGTPLRPVNSVSGHGRIWAREGRAGRRETEREERRLLDARIPAVCPPDSLSFSVSLYPSAVRTREEYRVTQTYRRAARQRGWPAWRILCRLSANASGIPSSNLSRIIRQLHRQISERTFGRERSRMKAGREVSGASWLFVKSKIAELEEKKCCSRIYFGIYKCIQARRIQRVARYYIQIREQ